MAELLRITRVPCGERVLEQLREQILAQIQYGEDDPRASNVYHGIDAHGNPNEKPGFFSTEYDSAINWEQVARQQQLSAWNVAAITPTPSGNVERRLWQTLQQVRGWHAFARQDGPVSVLRASRRRPTTSLATTPKGCASTGLQCSQMTKTGGLMSVLPLFFIAGYIFCHSELSGRACVSG